MEICKLQKRYKKHEDKSEPTEIYNNDNNEDKSELSNGNREEEGDDSLDDLKVSVFLGQIYLLKIILIKL